MTGRVRSRILRRAAGVPPQDVAGCLGDLGREGVGQTDEAVLDEPGDVHGANLSEEPPEGRTRAASRPLSRPERDRLPEGIQPAAEVPSDGERQQRDFLTASRRGR